MNLPKLGLGCLHLGGYGIPQNLVKNVTYATHRAIEYGIKLFDTAPIYSLGESERLLGVITHKKRKDVIISTKTGLVWTEHPKFKKYVDNSPETIEKQLNESLKRLQTDYIDIYLLHYPDVLVPIEDTMNAMLKFKKDGKILNIGYCNLNIADLNEALLYDNIIVQAIYNKRNFSNGLELLPFCFNHNVKVMSYSPLNGGSLSDDVESSFKFVMSNKAINTIIFGANNIGQLEQNIEFLGGIS